jgi:hypothetical protein
MVLLFRKMFVFLYKWEILLVRIIDVLDCLAFLELADVSFTNPTHEQEIIKNKNSNCSVYVYAPVCEFGRSRRRIIS